MTPSGAMRTGGAWTQAWDCRGPASGGRQRRPAASCHRWGQGPEISMPAACGSGCPIHRRGC